MALLPRWARLLGRLLWKTWPPDFPIFQLDNSPPFPHTALALPLTTHPKSALAAPGLTLEFQADHIAKEQAAHLSLVHWPLRSCVCTVQKARRTRVRRTSRAAKTSRYGNLLRERIQEDLCNPGFHAHFTILFCRALFSAWRS